MAAQQRVQRGRIVETRVMVDNRIVTVSDWFPTALNERIAIRQLQQRHTLQPHLVSDILGEDVECIKHEVEKNGAIGIEEI